MAREIVTSENREEYNNKKMGIKPETKEEKHKKIALYHGTGAKEAKHIEKHGFDVNKSADGTIWMTTDPKIGEVAAAGKGGIVKRYIDESKLKLGGHDEADKYSTDELINQGYHGLKFPHEEGHYHYQIFHPEMLQKN